MAYESHLSTDFVAHSAKQGPAQSDGEISRRRSANVLWHSSASLLVGFILTATAVGAEPPPLPTSNAEPAFESAPVSREAYEALLRRVEALEARETLNESKPEIESAPQNKQNPKIEPAPQSELMPKIEAMPRIEPSYFELSKEKWNVKLGGHVQLDYITWPDADPAIDDAENYFNYRRLRLVADGTGYGQFDFRLQLSLEPGEGSHEIQYASPDVKDAYLSMNEIPWIGRIRIGNFFVPFSLEQVTNDTNNIFNERSIPTQGIFSADREVGIAFYNCTEDKDITWSGGLFFDSISDTFKTRLDDNQGYRLSGRLTWLPYYDESSNGRYLVHTGAGVLHTDDQDDTVRFRARPQVQRGPVLIDSGKLAADTYTTGNLELAFVWGRFALQNEAFLSRVNMLNGEPTHAAGAYSHVSWFLTGENRIFERFGQHGAQFGRNVPYTNFSLHPGYCGWGAWEAKARCSYLDLTDVDAGEYMDLTAGFNWYWSDRTRIMLDWIHPWTTAETTFGDTSSDLMAMRFDFNW